MSDVEPHRSNTPDPASPPTSHAWTRTWQLALAEMQAYRRDLERPPSISDEATRHFLSCVDDVAPALSRLLGNRLGAIDLRGETSRVAAALQHATDLERRRARIAVFCQVLALLRDESSFATNEEHWWRTLNDECERVERELATHAVAARTRRRRRRDATDTNAAARGLPSGLVNASASTIVSVLRRFERVGTKEFEGDDTRVALSILDCGLAHGRIVEHYHIRQGVLVISIRSNGLSNAGRELVAELTGTGP